MREFCLESTDAQVFRGTLDVNLTVVQPVQNILTERETDESKENRANHGDAGFKYPLESESSVYNMVIDLPSQQGQNHRIPGVQVVNKKNRFCFEKFQVLCLLRLQNS